MGCTRAHYRRQADLESYGAIEERNNDPAWTLPSISIDAPPASRLYDPFDPDHSPMPPDDPAANQYMQRVFGMKGYRKWHKHGDAPWIEDPDWKNYLELDKDGKLVLTPDKAVELGVLDSGSYLTQLEGVYLSALALTLDRFQFELQWFGTNDTTFTHFGSSATEVNTLTSNSALGFNRFLATGGQIMAEFANTLILTYSPGNKTSIEFSNFLITFMQPLLQNSGRAVALETLTEGERSLLYSVRNFAHFRKQFSFQIATSNYLNLLSQEQSVRNTRSNLKTLQENLRLYQALYEAGKVSQVQVAQVDLSLQQAQLGLIQGETSLQAAEDSYKLLLGLPPDIPIRLDDSLLAPFQLASPALTKLQSEIEELQAQFRKNTGSTPAEQSAGLKKMETFRARLVKLVDEVESEIGKLKDQLAGAAADREQAARARAGLAEVTLRLLGVREDLESFKKKTAQAAADLAQGTLGSEVLTRQVDRLTGIASELFVIQTRVRVYLIQLPQIRYELAEATEYALTHRLDLMNQKGQVVDAWRQITVTASALQAGLNVVGSANIIAPPLGNRPFDFRASTSVYSAGIQVDTPLNRVQQRNAYRASLISYQQARRSYMALEDSIKEQIRDDLRQLNLNRIGFDIARQSLVSAALTYESSREQLLTPNADPTSTLNILQALSAVLTAENTLISSWVSYETTRYRLLLNMEELQLDERGLYTDEHNDRTEPIAANNAPPANPKTLPPTLP
jgi:outer membrane protein TolC